MGTAVAAKTLKIDPTTQVAQIIDADIVVNPEFVNSINYSLGILDNAKNMDILIFKVFSHTRSDMFLDCCTVVWLVQQCSIHGFRDKSQNSRTG